MPKQRTMELKYKTPEGKEAKKDITFVNTEAAANDVYNFGAALMSLTTNTLSGANQKDVQSYREIIDGGIVDDGGAVIHVTDEEISDDIDTHFDGTATGEVDPEIDSEIENELFNEE